MNNAIPAWCESLRDDLNRMADRIRNQMPCWSGPENKYLPENYGDARAVPATKAIQGAIDAAAAAGGGVVSLTSGSYVSGTLVMRSGVCLEICQGASLLASTDLADFPEHHAHRLTVQDTSMGMHQSLIFAEGCRGIALRGPGTIDGRGSQDHFPGDETAQGTPGRPFVIRMIDCISVHVSGLTLRNSPCWMENYLNCEDLHVEHLTVRNHANWNNDGIDIDGCRRVWMHDCDITSGDDALCFKGASQMPLEDVLVERCSLYSACNAVKVGTDTQGDFRRVLVRDCRIGGLAEDPSGLKHPWSDSGISLEMVDGGVLEDFVLSNLEITRTWSPFFLRLEDRGRVKPGDPKPPVGTLRRVLFEHIRGADNGPRGSYLLAVPEQPIRDIVFHDVDLTDQRISLRAPVREAAISDLRGVYPDAHMIDSLGDAPAWAFWARHVHGLTLSDYRVQPSGEDPRPEYVLDSDVSPCR